MSTISFTPGMVILGIISGTGLFTAYFAKLDNRLIALDILGKLLEKARTRNLPPDQISFLEQCLEDYPGEACFATVIGLSIIHHLEIQSATQSMFRLWKPGGRGKK